MKIILSPEDIIIADSVASLRDSESTRMGLQDAHGLQATSSEGEALSRLGARGEFAVKRALKHDGDLGVNTFKSADVGPYHVRTSKLPTASLILRPDDPEDGIYILVTTDDEVEFEVKGWIHKRDVTMDIVWGETWWRAPANRPGAWFVPQVALLPIETLGV